MLMVVHYVLYKDKKIGFFDLNIVEKSVFGRHGKDFCKR